MMEGIRKRLLLSLEKLDNQPQNDDLPYVPYGTAGFRGKAERVEHLIFKVGIIAGSQALCKQANVGVMITASHNPIEDNGVKIIDSRGEMLDLEWERIVEEFCNFRTKNNEELIDRLFELIQGHITDVRSVCGDVANHGKLFIGCDTRPSSDKFVELVKKGIQVWENVQYEFVGKITTPALHYIVGQASLEHDNSITEIDYYNKLVDGVVAIFECSSTVKQCYDATSLVVDCANGIGTKTMEYLCNSAAFMECLPVKIINTSKKQDDILNYECGADYVKTKHLPSRGANELHKRYASLDGDADRVVYFYLDSKNECNSNELKLLDGDKILTLYVKFLIDVMRNNDSLINLSVGAVQTAYANGASTDYLKNELKLRNVDCVDTGVKHLHRQAVKYDFGVYFEANGHGTIWISKQAIAIIRSNSIKEFEQLLGILNNYTGDAVSDILMVEMILRHYDWDVERWFKMYIDQPNALIKVEVKDRSCVVTKNAGQTCIKPEGLQEQIDRLVKKFGIGSRSFVRASGTENVVRIYAEAASLGSANELARLVGQEVIKACNQYA